MQTAELVGNALRILRFRLQQARAKPTTNSIPHALAGIKALQHLRIYPHRPFIVLRTTQEVELTMPFIVWRR